MLKERKHERFCCGRAAYAAIFRMGSLPVAGKIMDIGLGGIGFNYLGPTELERGDFTLQLFSSGGRLIHLRRISCSIVYSVKCPEQSWGEINSWRTGIRFKRLSPAALSELILFISDLAAT